MDGICKHNNGHQTHLSKNSWGVIESTSIVVIEAVDWGCPAYSILIMKRGGVGKKREEKTRRDMLQVGDRTAGVDANETRLHTLHVCKVVRVLFFFCVFRFVLHLRCIALNKRKW